LVISLNTVAFLPTALLPIANSFFDWSSGEVVKWLIGQMVNWLFRKIPWLFCQLPFYQLPTLFLIGQAVKW
jgi:hypothetical protein